MVWAHSLQSADALLKLWEKLNREKQLYEQNLPTARSSTQKQILVDWIALYSGLQGEVYGVVVSLFLAISRCPSPPITDLVLL